MNFVVRLFVQNMLMFCNQPRHHYNLPLISLPLCSHSLPPLSLPSLSDADLGHCVWKRSLELQPQSDARAPHPPFPLSLPALSSPPTHPQSLRAQVSPSLQGRWMDGGGLGQDPERPTRTRSRLDRPGEHRQSGEDAERLRRNAERQCVVSGASLHVDTFACSLDT